MTHTGSRFARRITRPLLGLLLSLSAAFAQAKDPIPAPDFSLPNLQGETVRLADLKGKVVMINFWASWCGPCRQEMPLLSELYNTYKRAGFELLGVNLDGQSGAAQRFLERTPVTFPVLLDPKGTVAGLYQNQAMPSSYFINRKGELVHLHQGYRPGEEEEYRRIIRKLLAE